LSGLLIDTNVLIDLVFERSEPLSLRFSAASLSGEALFLSAVSIFEYRFGAERSRRRGVQLEALERLLLAVTVIEFDEADATRAALLKGALTARGEMIGPYDLLIAAQGLERMLTVVTGDTREFSRVEGLALEDWRASA
jgi:tRNA(fMet)-specific endonuclease VapC